MVTIPRSFGKINMQNFLTMKMRVFRVEDLELHCMTSLLEIVDIGRELDLESQDL